jgi:predicted MFS family arabinose efflux permease
VTLPAGPRWSVVARWLPGVLQERQFRLFFTGNLTSNFGTQMAPVAIAFAVLGEGYGATEVGLVLMAQAIPLVVLVMASGVLADRLGPRVVMLGADVLRLAAHGTLAVLLLTGRPGLLVFIVVEVFVGVGDAMFGPAVTGLIPRVATGPRLQQANALLAAGLSTGQVAGPAVAGIVVATVGPGWAVAADAATYLVSAICLALLHMPRVVASATESIVAQLAAGWREFTSHTWLWVIVLWASFFLMLSYAPYLVLGAVVAKNEYGGAGAWGTILAVQGVGALCGALVMMRVRVERPLLVASLGTFLYAAPIAALALHAPLVVVAAAAFIAGLSLSGWDTLWATTVQREIPPDMLARVSSYDWLGSVALLPVGFALVGPLAHGLGLTGALWFAAGSVVVSTLATLAVPSLRELRAPPASPPAAPPTPPTAVEAPG